MRSRTGQPLAFDDRGRACDLIDPTACDLPPGTAAELPDPGLLGKGYHAQVHWTLLVTSAIVIVILVLLIGLLKPLGWTGGLLAAPLAMGLSGIAYRLIGRPWRRAVAGQIIGVALRSKRCPGCGYSLDCLAPADDGCVQCPECGAAWLMPSPDARG